MKINKNWHPFDEKRGYHQKRPPERKFVLVILERTTESLPRAIAVGYMKNSAGQKQYPYFVIPGIGGKVVAWSDTLPDELSLDFWYKENNEHGYQRVK